MPYSIDEIILQAMQEGKFDQLPGKGKPLKLEDNPHEDPSWRLAHHILKTSGFSLPWIEALRDIENTFYSIDADLKTAWGHYGEHSVDGQAPDECKVQWQRATHAFRERIADLNINIRKVNLAVPAYNFSYLSSMLNAKYPKSLRLDNKKSCSSAQVGRDFLPDSIGFLNLNQS
jgi:DnaJ homologue, subfamily C, member 28, conserved domain